MYTFNKSSQDEIMDNIDSVELVEKLFQQFHLPPDKFEAKLKKIIRTPDEFYKLVEEYYMTDKEFIDLLAKGIPEIFNHRLVKFIRETYIFKNENNT